MFLYLMTVLCMLVISLLSHRYVYFKCVYVWIKQKAKTKKTSSGNSTSQISEYLPQFLILIILKDFSHKTLNEITGFSMIMDLKRTLTCQKNCIICFIESPLKIMKNAFYFILKTFFVLKIFQFLSWLFNHVEKIAWLER